MAATYGRLTGKTGVCLATLGPGATNFVTAAAYAQLGGDADADDHRPEADQSVQAGPVPDRRHGRHDAAADQVHQPDRRPPTTSPPACAKPSAAPRKNAPAPSTSNCPRTSPTSSPTRSCSRRAIHRRPVADDKAIGHAVGRDRRGQAPDPDDRRRRQPQDQRQDAARVHRQDRHPVLHHPDGQGRGRRDATRCGWATPRSPTATSCTARSKTPTASSTSATT